MKDLSGHVSSTLGFQKSCFPSCIGHTKNNSQYQKSKYPTQLVLWQLDLEGIYHTYKLINHNLISCLEGLWYGDDTVFITKVFSIKKQTDDTACSKGLEKSLGVLTRNHMVAAKIPNKLPTLSVEFPLVSIHSFCHVNEKWLFKCLWYSTKM